METWRRRDCYWMVALYKQFHRKQGAKQHLDECNQSGWKKMTAEKPIHHLNDVCSTNKPADLILHGHKKQTDI